jgi:hypothetical protein
MSYQPYPHPSSKSGDRCKQIAGGVAGCMLPRMGNGFKPVGAVPPPRMDGLARVIAAAGAPPALPGGAGPDGLSDPNLADSDNDGLRDGEEVTTFHTKPLAGDSDGDGFLDGYEVETGKSPINPLDKLALVAGVRTASELTSSAALGKTYRIEASTDLKSWEILESGVSGTGGQVQRFYST